MSENLSDAKRLEELFRYFLGVSKATGLAKYDVDSHEVYDPGLAHISSDPVLNALCQLGAVRLACDRAFVSLIDNRHQYVAAEMTKGGSLVDNLRHPPGMPVCIGTSVLDLVAGVCAGTMPAFLSEQPTIRTSNIYADRSRYVINDFSQEEMYRSRPYVVGYPHMRYYAEVPIKAASGHVIGTYAVVDSTPRHGLDEEQYLILADIALSIMRHLETLKIESDHNRASTLLRGLDAFVQKNKRKSDLERNRRNGDHARRSPYTSMPKDSSNPNHLPSAADQWSNTTQSRNLSDNAGIRADQRATLGGPVPDRTSSSHVRQHSASNGSFLRDAEDAPTPVSDYPSVNGASESFRADASESANDSGITNTFSRAANLLRGAMDLDGVVFLDASFSGFGSRISPDWLEESMMKSQDGDVISPTSPIYTDFDTRPGNTSPNTTLASCLGSSSQRGIAVNGLYSLPQSVHQSLIRYFPRGEVFVLADELSVTKTNLEMCYEPQSALDPPGNSALRREYAGRLVVEDALRSFFPGAQTVLFFPLWNPYKSNWYAGSIAWSTQSKRIFEQQDFSYFSVFGNSVMLEIVRLEMVASDRAMSNFISSISHELRSPLHGILGSAELLREAASEADRNQLTGIIESCGQTLLQNFDQILDYAKLNAKATVNDKEALNSSAEPQQAVRKVADQATNASLTVLIEESIQGILVGHHYKMSRQSSPTHGHDTATEDSTDPNEKPVVVIVNLDEKVNVLASVDTAAWHRTILNVVGNALKYTATGSIEISLTMPESRSRVHLVVSDTGSGMSENYLRNHLFTPFMQEDALYEGTGLGMSIVKQLLDSLGGSVQVSSKLGQGTKVAMSMPLSHGTVSEPSSLTQYPEASIAMLALAPTDAASLALRNALSQSFRDWYGAKVSETSKVTDIRAELVVISETDLYALSRGLPPDTSAAITGKCTFIIACTRHGFHDREGHLQSGRVFYLYPPYGPHQVGRVLQKALAVDVSTDLTLDIRRNGEATSLHLIHPHSKSEKVSPVVVQQQTPIKHSSSTSEGANGTTHLPATPTDLPVLAKPPPARKPHILLVDDNPLNLSILVRSVQKLNCDFDTAVNGLDAVNKFIDAYNHSEHPRPFDVVFMDISMPVMTGFEATRAIRDFERKTDQERREAAANSESSPSPPVARASQIIAMTGLGSAEAQAEALTSGMNTFLKKPVQIKTIRALLEGKS